MPSAGDTPGWQADPDRPGMLRWWNGLGWSDAYRAPEQLSDRDRQAMAEARRISTVTSDDVQQVQRAVGAAGPAAQRVASSARPAVAAGREAGRAVVTNTLGAAAIAVGVIGLIFGFGGILSLLALLISLRGIARSRRLAARGVQKTGLGQSLVGLLVSIAGLIHGVPQLVGFVGDIVNS